MLQTPEYTGECLSCSSNNSMLGMNHSHFSKTILPWSVRKNWHASKKEGWRTYLSNLSIWKWPEEGNFFLCTYFMFVCCCTCCVCLYLYEEGGDGYTGGLWPKMVSIVYCDPLLTMTSFAKKHYVGSLTLWLIVDTLLISKLFTSFRLYIWYLGKFVNTTHFSAFPQMTSFLKESVANTETNGKRESPHIVIMLIFNC